MSAALIKFFSQYGTLPIEGTEELERHFKTKNIQKGKRLLKKGQVCDKIYFVEKGCLRLYYINDKDIEITVWFSFENNSAIELSSYLSGTPSDYYIEAIEDSQLRYINKTELTYFYEKYPTMERLMRIFWEDVIQHLLKRFTALQKDSAEKRYLDLMNEPTYLQRVPQKFLASYIGVTPTSLSRIRRNIK